jgi:prolyl-tRNA editing enzyme YbaK/EbsC (Cys-tRNA(Pro) deacylase)
LERACHGGVRVADRRDLQERSGECVLGGTVPKPVKLKLIHLIEGTLFAEISVAALGGGTGAHV